MLVIYYLYVADDVEGFDKAIIVVRNEELKKHFDQKLGKYAKRDNQIKY